MTEVLQLVEKCPCKSILVIFLGQEKSRCLLHEVKKKHEPARKEQLTFVSAIQLAEEFKSCIMHYLLVSALCIKVFKATVLQKENKIIT